MGLLLHAMKTTIQIWIITDGQKSYIFGTGPYLLLHIQVCCIEKTLYFCTRVSDWHLDTTNNWTLIHVQISHTSHQLYHRNEGWVN